MRNATTVLRRIGGIVLTGTLLGCASVPTSKACGPAGFDRVALLEWKAADFVVEDDSKRNSYALALTECLSNTDSVLRDNIGYTGLTALLRSGKLTNDTVVALKNNIGMQLQQPDREGFRQPFAALALSEVVRADRIKPMFTAAERNALVHLAVGYMKNIRDYRGFDDTEGWRHGVAHGADLLLQLTLNPNVSDDAMPAIINAALSQVAAHDGHAYVYGEPGRLGRPVMYAAQRMAIANDAWAPLLMSLAQPNGMKWKDAYGSESSLARLHNTRAFLEGMYSQIAEVEAQAFQPFVAAVRDAMRALP